MASTTFIPQTPPADDVTVVNNGWFPDLTVNRFRSEMRIVDADNAEIESRLREAMIRCNDALLAWSSEKQDAGYQLLAEAPADQYGNESKLELLYRQAVHYCAKRLLIEQQRNLDTHSSGQQRADVMAPAISDLQIEEDRALRSIRGESGSIHVVLL